MKFKILILLTAIALLTLAMKSYAQLNNVPLKLVNSSNVPLTGQAANIQFRYSPFGSGNVIGGLTVTETGTTGNYIITGFTTLQKSKLFVYNGSSWVEQTWWGGSDGIYTGDIVSYISGLNIPSLSGTNTWTGVNSFTVNNTAFYTPLLSGSNPWLSDYSLLPLHAILDKTICDSLYFSKSWGFKNGSTLFFNQKIARPNLTTPLFDASNQFNWNGSTGLNLNIGQDSMAFNTMTIKKDTTDAGDNLLTKSWAFERKNHAFIGPDSTQIVVEYSRTTNGSYVSGSEFNLINNTVIQQPSSPSPFSLSTIAKVDSLTLPWAGVYTVEYSAAYQFISGHPANCTDSIQTLLSATTAALSPVTSNITPAVTVTWVYNNTNNSGTTACITWKGVYTNPTAGTKVYLKAAEFASTSGFTHFINNWYIEATLIY